MTSSLRPELEISSEPWIKFKGKGLLYGREQTKAFQVLIFPRLKERGLKKMCHVKKTKINKKRPGLAQRKKVGWMGEQWFENCWQKCFILPKSTIYYPSCVELKISVGVEVSHISGRFLLKGTRDQCFVDVTKVTMKMPSRFTSCKHFC